MAGWQRDGATRDEPLVDFVLKFEAIPKVYANGKKRVPEQLAQERAEEYTRLERTLQEQGLNVTSRVGPANSGHVLLFVHAPDYLLTEMRSKER